MEGKILWVQRKEYFEDAKTISEKGKEEILPLKAR